MQCTGDFEQSEEINDLEDSVSSAMTIQWYSTYNLNSTLPTAKRHNGKVALPALLDSNPDLKDAIITFCNENLVVISSELLHSYLVETCLPTLLSQRQAETKTPSMTMAELLKENRLNTLHPRTVNNWLLLLGYKYSPRKKTTTTNTKVLKM